MGAHFGSGKEGIVDSEQEGTVMGAHFDRGQKATVFGAQLSGQRTCFWIQ